ncbi:MAG: HIT family protein [Acidiferrobacteraceae bacterium]|nr:HIT family protein [Acidiferrobacteraceae bacterium]
MSTKDNDCLFCRAYTNQLIAEDDFCYASRDSFPVSTGHSLIIPKRHVANYFDLTESEVIAIHNMLLYTKQWVELNNRDVTAFNIGVNAGHDAGQSIHHVHVHLIPRRKGDVANPQGGVRGVIPHKQHYVKD